MVVCILGNTKKLTSLYLIVDGRRWQKGSYDHNQPLGFYHSTDTEAGWVFACYQDFYQDLMISWKCWFEPEDVALVDFVAMEIDLTSALAHQLDLL